MKTDSEKLLDVHQIALLAERKVCWVYHRIHVDPAFPKLAGFRIGEKKKAGKINLYRKSEVEQYLQCASSKPTARYEESNSYDVIERQIKDYSRRVKAFHRLLPVLNLSAL